ncbi:MAG: hypothetical protein QXT55_02745 [Desulfurococcus sp.]
MAVPAALSGLFYAKLVGSKIYIEPKVEVGYEKIREEYEKLPPASLAFASLIVPIVLIVLKSVAEFPSKPFGSGLYVDIIRFLGEPVMALFIGMIISFLLVPKFDEKVYGPEGWVGEALKTASIIILITGAGGSFGYVIRQTGIGEFLGSLASGYGGGKLLGLTNSFWHSRIVKNRARFVNCFPINHICSDGTISFYIRP